MKTFIAASVMGCIGMSASARAEGKKATGEARIELEKLGLAMSVPAGTKIVDVSTGSTIAFSLSASGGFAVSVSEAMGLSAEIDKAAATVKNINPGFKSYTKQEKIEGGWLLEFESTSLSDKAPLYGVMVRKKIGERSYHCGHNDRAVQLRDTVEKACLSMTKR